MHGFIFYKLKQFIESEYTSSAWMQILRDSGIGYKSYWPAYMYPDEEMFALISTATEVTNTKRAELLEAMEFFLHRV